MTLLHHVTFGNNQTGFQVAMCINSLAHSFGKTAYVHSLKTIEIWNIILCRVTVHLPVDVHTTLVLSQGIAVLAFVSRQLGYVFVWVCIGLREGVGYFTDGRLPHDGSHRDLLSQFFLDSYVQLHHT